MSAVAATFRDVNHLAPESYIEGVLAIDAVYLNPTVYTLQDGTY